MKNLGQVPLAWVVCANEHKSKWRRHDGPAKDEDNQVDGTYAMQLIFVQVAIIWKKVKIREEDSHKEDDPRGLLKWRSLALIARTTRRRIR